MFCFGLVCLGSPRGMWDLSFPTMDQTHVPALEVWRHGVLTTGPPGKSKTFKIITSPVNGIPVTTYLPLINNSICSKSRTRYSHHFSWWPCKQYYCESMWQIQETTSEKQSNLPKITGLWVEEKEFKSKEIKLTNTQLFYSTKMKRKRHLTWIEHQAFSYERS